jgi:hypothetical protein
MFAELSHELRGSRKRANPNFQRWVMMIAHRMEVAKAHGGTTVTRQKHKSPRSGAFLRWAILGSNQ